MDLCEAFTRVLDSVGGKRGPHEVTYDDTPISLHAEDIADRLQREGPMTLQQVFIGRRNRSELIGLFLATLELVRQRKVRVKQGEPGGEIGLELRPSGVSGAGVTNRRRTGVTRRPARCSTTGRTRMRNAGPSGGPGSAPHGRLKASSRTSTSTRISTSTRTTASMRKRQRASPYRTMTSRESPDVGVLGGTD